MYKKDARHCTTQVVRKMGQAAVVAALCGTAALAYAAPTVAPFFLDASSTYIFNDRIGNSRFFNGANSDRIRVGTYVVPSPDTDVYPITVNGTQYISNNGSSTTVSADAALNAGLLPTSNGLNLTFTGVTSGRGGGLNEYTQTILRSAYSPQGLGLLDNTPLTLTVRNPRAAGSTEVNVQTPDYDPSALPGFVRDLKLTGGGLTPTISWQLPPDGVAPTRVTIQIRRIDGESDDHSRITSATLLDVRTIALGTTSYDFSKPFSNAELNLPSGLELGKKYEIAVQLDVLSPGGALNGRARTFFEFTPLPVGQGQVAVVLPSIGPDGIFKFDVTVSPGETIALDPVVAIGYDYQIGAGNPLFASVSLPAIGDGLFDLYLFDGLNYVFKQVLQAGEQFFFGGAGVDRFRILGIEANAGLDPADATAFITNVTFAGAGRFTGTMTPITLAVADLPEPGVLLLSLAALGALWWSRRRRTALCSAA